MRRESPTVTARAAHVAIAVGIGMLLVTVLVSAQWQTPSRAFHQGGVFPLDGKHLSVACASCHIVGQTKGTPTTCADCHWVRRQDDKYRTRLGMACEQCHRTTSWTTVKWDHAAQAGMPLNAPHKTLSCETCHKNAVFTGGDLTCGTCHAADYATARTPDHKAAGFPPTCELCHRASDNAFRQGRFDHNAVFALSGRHATVDCASCHRNGVYQGAPRQCVGCHRTDYERTTKPNHIAAGMSTDCASCHRPSDMTFTGTTFNHNSVFPLVGRHATQICATCHINNVYQGTTRDCVGCHRADYQRTTSPNHAASGFSTACDTCHRPTDTTWGSGGFNHNSVFPLVGRHATAICSVCHVNNVFKGTPRVCVTCHQTQYQRTTNPNHIAAGFPTACDACHSAGDASWNQGRFTHTWFPITSGRHSNIACATCHTNSASYAQFSCLTSCHARTETDSHHRNRNGYAYDSNRCYACHPNGRAG